MFTVIYREASRSIVLAANVSYEQAIRIAADQRNAGAKGEIVLVDLLLNTTFSA